MTHSPQTHYLNAEFDLSLRARPGRVLHPRLVRQTRELSAQALLGAEAGDAVLLRAKAPGEFLDHLDACGIAVPRLLVHPRCDPETRLRPFGWSAEAMALNELHGCPVAHPPLPTIRRVNARSFALGLEAEVADASAGTLVGGTAELEAFLSRVPSGSEWIVKAEHGNSGLANRRLRAPGLSAADCGFVDDMFAEDDRAVVEPWLARERDWCVVFDVPLDPAALRVHETECTRDGALIGALFRPGETERMPWAGELSAMAERVASRLEDEGYFGPVCVDAFSWRDGDTVRLRPLVDLNGRRSMSDAAWRLWRRIAPDRTVYYRFFNRRKLTLPSELPQALAALGHRGYDRARRRGILLASPLRFGEGKESWRPAKQALLFVGRDHREILALEHDFRARFES